MQPIVDFIEYFQRFMTRERNKKGGFVMKEYQVVYRLVDLGESLTKAQQDLTNAIEFLKENKTSDCINHLVDCIQSQLLEVADLVADAKGEISEQKS